MRLAIALLAAPAVLGACVDMDDHGPPVVGTSGDVQTAPGDYVGYRVVTPCDEAYVNVGVIGTGSVTIPNVEDIAPVSGDIYTTLGDLKSVWGYSGASLVCEPGVGATISTSSWRDVDTMIARIGDYLSTHDLALQVGISVETIPVADAK
jgi:hypothetical protein